MNLGGTVSHLRTRISSWLGNLTVARLGHHPQSLRRSIGRLVEWWNAAPACTVLESGTVGTPRAARTRGGEGPRDSETPLSVRRRVRRYTNDAATRAFLERERLRMAPGQRKKSGAKYRLSRWREEQLAAGATLTYGQLARKLHRALPDRGVLCAGEIGSLHQFSVCVHEGPDGCVERRRNRCLVRAKADGR